MGGSEEAVKAAARALANYIGHGMTEKCVDKAKVAITAALPHLPGVGVKKLEWDGQLAKTQFGNYTYDEEDRGWRYTFHDCPYGVACDEYYSSEDAVIAAAQADYEARILSALEPSVADMGNPITDKTVKRRIADALEYVWSALDCDVEHIDSIIAHMQGNGLYVIEGQNYRRMAEAIQQASAYLALTQPNSAEKIISDLDAALKPEVGNPATEASAARELALEEGDLNARLKAKGMYSIDEMMGNLPIDKWRVHSGMTDLTFFGEWLERKSREYLTMKAAYDVGDKDESDELYEWVLAHYGAFHDVLVNFRAALSSPDHADAGKVEGDGWLPIESAPREEPYLAFEPHGMGGFMFVACMGTDGQVRETMMGSPMKPTHWRPLPSAPSQEVAGS